MEKKLSLKELCKEISISEATGRNWLRLGKIKADKSQGKTVYFSGEYADELKRELESHKGAALKSRRNKKYVSGSSFYDSYISEESGNAAAVQRLLSGLDKYKINLSEGQLCMIIAECALRFFVQSKSETEKNADNKDNKNKDNKNKENANKKSSYLLKYIRKELSVNIYDSLINDLLETSESMEEAVEFIEKYVDLFAMDVIYESKEDVLGLIYMSCRNIGNRKSAGAYYTPTYVVRQLVYIAKDMKEKTILDPCCGTGNFLLQLPDSVSIENIYGNDIDSLSVKITRINMALKYKIEDIKMLYHNFSCGDFLHSHNDKYDCIIGNPPWGYDYSEAEAMALRGKYVTAGGKNIESFDVFVEKALKNLKITGVLAFVLPESLLNVNAHKTVRQLILQKCSLKYIKYLGEVFHGVQCPSVILTLEYTGRRMSTVGTVVETANNRFTIQKERYCACNDSEFPCLSATDEEYEIIERMKNRQDVCYLKDNAQFALGIVTGDNKKHLLDNGYNIPGSEPVVRGSDIEKYRYTTEKYILYQPDSFQQVAPLQYYRAKEKLLYRFIGGRLVFAYDDRQVLSLNSCNILIPSIEGLDIKYIMAVLNSTAVQFFCEKMFRSMKLLRQHIEQIPIPRISAKEQAEIVGLVNKILHEEISPEEYNNLVAEIDSNIYRIFNSQTTTNE